MFARLIGTGSCLPGSPVSNIDLAARGIDTTDEWIVSRTGIRSRLIADSATTSSELAVVAAQRALEMAGVSAAELDLIIVATSTPDFIFPSTACLVQGKLGNTGAAAFDVQAVCSGFAYALGIAEKFIRSGSHKKALVIGAEVFSRILDWSDRSTCVLFGDGAGAVVLEASDSPGILATAMHADGRQNGILNVPGQVCGGQVVGDPFLRMDGQAVFKFAVRVLTDVAEEVCQVAKIKPHDIDWFIPHQANIRIIEATGRKLGIDQNRVIVTVDHHGNTSAASVPLALDEAVRDGRIQHGQRVLVEGVGGGFTWGAALLSIDRLENRQIMSFAFVFPGQGSQSVAMMAAYGESAVVRATFDEASVALGEDLWKMVEEGPADILAQTINTQPVMLTAGVAVWRLWCEKGGKRPAVVAGHSLGEYSALVVSGVLNFKDAVPLVRLRAAAMQEAVPLGTGAMAAVLGLDTPSIVAACVESAQGEIVEPVNFNANGQTVIAGHKAAVDRAMRACKNRGAKIVKALPVSAPFHCSLIRPAANKLAARLADLTLNAPVIPVINNVDVSIEIEPSNIKDALVRQAYNPVRWVETIQKMATIGVATVAECGPGKILAGLTKRCADGLTGVALSDAASINANLGLE